MQAGVCSFEKPIGELCCSFLRSVEQTPLFFWLDHAALSYDLAGETQRPDRDNKIDRWGSNCGEDSTIRARRNTFHEAREFSIGNATPNKCASSHADGCRLQKPNLVWTEEMFKIERISQNEI